MICKIYVSPLYSVPMVVINRRVKNVVYQIVRNATKLSAAQNAKMINFLMKGNAALIVLKVNMEI